jgi:peptidoglycan/xylan/chitin deacetylase (PgdA/CDA1 family)
MHRYFIKTPGIIKRMFPSYLWQVKEDGNAVYLSFDDGPHPTITPWVLDLLKEHGAVATFFCIGNNVRRFPEVYQRILREGHAVGNHTYHHVNGWKRGVEKYLADVAEAEQFIESRLFRPPYGRIKRSQANALKKKAATIVMWDVLSADFDVSFSPQQCVDHVTRNARPGSIIVFHDSEKAFANLQYCLPKVLEFFKEAGYAMKKIQEGALIK